MTELVLLWVVLIAAIIASGFFSGTETGVYCLNRVRLRVRSAQDDPAARRLGAMMDQPESLVITALMGTNIADYVATACVAALVLRAGATESMAELYTTLLATPLVLVFGGIIPKDLFQRRSDRLMYPLSLPLAACRAAARWSGILGLLRGLTHWLIRVVDPRGTARDEDYLPRAHVRRLLYEGAARGGLTSFQRETIERIMNLSQVRVGRVMIPLRRAAALPVGIAREDFLRAARMAHFSRYPVYEGDPRRVIGVASVFEVLTDEQKRPIREYVREAVYLRADDPVPTALLKLQQSGLRMGIVQDRGGACVGLLTMKDLVEEIVGEVEAW